MKRLLATLMMLGLVLGVGSAYALENDHAFLIYGPELTYAPDAIPTDLAQGFMAPVLFTAWTGRSLVYGEDTISEENGFELESMVADARGVSVADVANEPALEGGIINVYEAIGHPNPWLGQDGE